MIVAPTDKAAADRLLTSLKTFISLGGGQQGVTVREEDYNGTTISIVDLGDVSKLPARPARLAGHAAADRPCRDRLRGHRHVVVVGSGPGFVKHVLDTTPGTSLASNEATRSSPTGPARARAPSTSPSRPSARLVEKAAVRADRPPARVPDRRQAVPGAVRRDARGGSDLGRPHKSVVVITVK